jgi:type I restriction enzyme, S subunit
MSTPWQLTPFDDFIKLRKRFITIQDNSSYERVTVQLHSKGIIKRDTVLGSQIKTKKQQVIKAYDLLVAEIDAKVGGFGIVPPEFDGAIVSGHYFTYEVDTDIIDLDYLEYYLHSDRPTEDVQQYVKGSTNYAAIRDYHFPKLNVPLPSIEDQQRIVTILDAFTEHIDEALGLLNSMTEEARDVISVSIETFQNSLPADQCKTQTLEQVTQYIQRGISPDYANTGDVLIVNQKCVRPEGLVLKPARYLANEQVSKIAEERFLRSGDVLLNSTGEGTLGRSTVVISTETMTVVDSHVTVIRANQDLVLPKWIDYFLKSVSGQQQIQVKKTGSTKQTELGRSSVLGLQMIIPNDLEMQRKIVEDIDKATQTSYSLINQLDMTTTRLTSFLPMLLANTFIDSLDVTLPVEVFEEVNIRKVHKRMHQQEVLAKRHSEAELQQEEERQMEKTEVKEASDLTRLMRQHLNEEGRIEVGAFWQLLKPSLPDIDTFYAYLKVESIAGRVIQVRDSHRVYLELGNEVATVMD